MAASVLWAPFVFGAATNFTSQGYRASEGGGGAISTGWTGGNLGNTWAEGEWVPYKFVITNVQTDYPGLAGFPDIEISYDFTKSGARFVDLVRGLQVGTTDLTDAQGWPKADGTAFPVTTRAQIETAQNGAAENIWTGFTALNLPNTQINRALDGSVGTPTDERRKFIIKKSDLLAAGIPTSANTIVIYYQLHESRSFIWKNALQSGYNAAPTNSWARLCLWSGAL